MGNVKTPMLLPYVGVLQIGPLTGWDFARLLAGDSSSVLRMLDVCCCCTFVA